MGAPKMDNDEKQLTIEFGALSRPLGEQVPGLSRRDARYFQQRADWITNLLIVGILTESEGRRARERLIKKLVRAIKHDQVGELVNAYGIETAATADQ